MPDSPRDISPKQTPLNRRRFTKEFKKEAVQMLLDGHSASSVCKRLGLKRTNILYRWKRELLAESGGTSEIRDDRVEQLEAELRRVERERDILKKALAIFGRHE